jgi:hypothetical protein
LIARIGYDPAGPGCTNLTATFSPLTPPRAGADEVMELRIGSLTERPRRLGARRP